MTKKNVCLIFTLSFMVGSNLSWAQFNKYRSTSKFNTEPTKRIDETSTPDVDLMDPADAQIVNEATPPAANSTSPVDAMGPATDAGAPSAPAIPTAELDSDEDEADDNSDLPTFGPRPQENAGAKNPQYVNLNPETAFGPEIVQSFDFPDTDIMELTRHMQKLTGINLILDKDVKGKVSIIAPTPITVGDAWKAYLTALNMAGYTLVKSGAFYKVLNARDIRYTPTKIYTGNYTPDTENYVMRVIALKNVSASEIARNFRPFMSRYGRIIDIKQTNTVIMADTGTNINRLVKMVKFLDVPGHEESLQIVKVKNSSAQEIAKLLDSILKGGSGANARSGVAGGSSPRFATPTGDSSSASSISRIIAEPRTNSIIAMANAEGARQLKELINKLDVTIVSSGSGRVHVYYLNYGDSEELSKTLSSIVTGNVAKDGGAAPRFGSAGGASESPIFTAEVKITSDKNNNALVVTASPTDWLTLKDVIGRLDIPRDQVYVEGLIIEANIQKENAFGVQFAGAYGQGSAQRAGFTGGSDLWNLIGGNPTALSGFFAGAGIGPSRTIKIGSGTTATDVKVNGVNALIKAVASHQNSNVLATPQILALDNTEATFEVGDTVPVRNSSIGQGGVQNFNTTTQEAKLSLKITPQINKVTRFIKLKINQRIDDFKPVDASVAQGGGGVPTTTRSAITEVMVKDRDTIAMGGLLRDKEVINFSKVPVLGDIPILGWLFKSKSKTINKVNLLFFMTPKIIAPYDKIASSNTLEILEKRENNLKGIFDADSIDPNTAKLKDLKAKVELQTKGPLYDEEDANHYKNLNDRALQKGSEQTEAAAPVEEPNYQEILEEVKETKKEE